MNIFVGSLSFKMTEEELQREFEAFGEVASVKIILDQTTLKSRGFAFVTMPNDEQATAAIAGLNGREINGFALKVNEARPRESRGSYPRESSGGGYAGGGRSAPSYTPRPAPTGGYGGGYGGGRGRSGGGGSAQDLDIYDTKGGRNGGGHGRKGKGGGRGRSGGGKNSY